MWEDGLMTGRGVSQKEACSPIGLLASPKSIMKIGTWNVRMMNQTKGYGQMMNIMLSNI